MTKKQEKKRNEYIDILKGVAIVLVVVGHCIQFGSGVSYLENNEFFQNIVFRFIYSFHMPLFVLISGYLFYNTLSKKDVKAIIKSRINTLVLPIFVWTILQNILLFICGKNDSFNLFSSIDYSFSNWTFLWALFIIILLVMLIEKAYNGKLAFYIALIILTNLLNEPRLNFMFYLLPYFIIGYKVNRYKDVLKKYINLKTLIISSVVLTVLFVVMLKHFNYPNYIYTSEYYVVNNIENLANNLFRFSVGLIGSYLACTYIYIIRKLLQKTRIFTILGRNTLGIYIISCVLNGIVLMDGITKDFEFSYINVIVESIIMLLVSCLLTIIIKKSKILSRTLFGCSSRK